MKINSVLNILSSICHIGNSMKQTFSNEVTNLLETNLIKGKYVTREEFNILKEQYNLLKIQLPKNNNLKYNDNIKS